MLKIALTGGIACGKSLAGSVLRSKGIAVCEADQLAHALMLPGQPAYAEIVREFGAAVLNADGTINRTRLGERVFTDAAERARLNAIVHPRVRVLYEEWLGACAAQPDCAMAVVIIPLLFEAGMERGWDAIICVRAPVEAQRMRLQARGMTVAQAEQRMAAQMPVDEKARRADYTIENDGTVTELERRTLDVVHRIRESKHGRTR